MDVIYLDNNATTPLLPAAWESMRPFLTEHQGNPASAHSLGRRARRALEDAREQFASLVGAFTDELIFTSGATEANNLAMFGLAGSPPAPIVISAVEHPSITEPALQLRERGFQTDLLPVDGTGTVQADALSTLLRPETRLVSIMLANNETGTVQPIAELARIVGGRAAFHCDAAQAVGRIAVDFHSLGVTSLALSAHKFHGPKGVGVLLLKRHTKLLPMLWGGHQQRGMRPGTEPVGLVAGMACALECACRDLSARRETVLHLRRRFLDHLRSSVPPVVLNGPEEGGIPHTINVSFPGCRADSLLMNLDLAGVCCSTGSACSSGSLLPSPVLRSMNVPAETLHSAMRFSLNPFQSEAEIDEAARRIANVVERLRGSAG